MGIVRGVGLTHGGRVPDPENLGRLKKRGLPGKQKERPVGDC